MDALDPSVPQDWTYMKHGRRTFLTAGAGLAISALPVSALSAPSGGPTPFTGDPLAALREGNARFVEDRAACPPLTARRLELASGQSPFAIIVSCSDSRVPVETVFDQIPGHIFGVRVAGNFVDEHGLGSIEYSVAALKSALILVLGHTSCGAIKATVDFVKDGTAQPDHIQSLVETLAPAVRSARHEAGDWVRNATIANARETLASIPARSPIVRAAHAAGTLSLAAGIYDLHSGRVEIFA